MSGRILLTGATGFTGSFVVDELKKRGAELACLVRPTSDSSALQAAGVSTVIGDINDVEQMTGLLRDFDTLVNVASIGFGAGPKLVKACEQAGVSRAVFVSTTALFTNLNAQSKKVRVAAEEAIRSSSLDYTILRPTMIYGTPGDRNMVRLLRLIERYRVVPVFGSGESLQQPVHVADVAWAIAEVIGRDCTVRKEYNISGAAPLTYNQVLEQAGEALGKRAVPVHLPLKPGVVVLAALRRWGLRTPVTDEQLLRLNEDKAFDHDSAREDFGYNPRTFRDGIASEVALMRGVA